MRHLGTPRNCLVTLLRAPWNALGTVRPCGKMEGVLTVEAIRGAADDEVLFKLLTGELDRLMPPEVQGDPGALRAAIAKAPRGMRAMAAVHPLDVSMALDDLAWHFGNHPDLGDALVTLEGLRELGLDDAVEWFGQVIEIVKPYLHKYGPPKWRFWESFPDWLERTGIQKKCDPLNHRWWRKYSHVKGGKGLMDAWAPYARRFPERCVQE